MGTPVRTGIAPGQDRGTPLAPSTSQDGCAALVVCLLPSRARTFLLEMQSATQNCVKIVSLCHYIYGDAEKMLSRVEDIFIDVLPKEGYREQKSQLVIVV